MAAKGKRFSFVNAKHQNQPFHLPPSPLPPPPPNIQSWFTSICVCLHFRSAAHPRVMLMDIKFPSSTLCTLFYRQQPRHPFHTFTYTCKTRFTSAMTILRLSHSRSRHPDNTGTSKIRSRDCSFFFLFLFFFHPEFRVVKIWWNKNQTKFLLLKETPAA